MRERKSIQYQIRSNLSAQKRYRRNIRKFEKENSISSDIRISNRNVEHGAKEWEQQLEELGDSEHRVSASGKSPRHTRHRVHSPIMTAYRNPHPIFHNGSSAQASNLISRSDTVTQTEYSSLDDPDREHESDSETPIGRNRHASESKVEEDQDYIKKQYSPQYPSNRDSVTITGMRIREDGTTLQEFKGDWPPSIMIMTDDRLYIGHVEDVVDGPLSSLREPSINRKLPEERRSIWKGKELMHQGRLRKRDDQGPFFLPESSHEEKTLSEGEN
jgi:hypothetical protein